MRTVITGGAGFIGGHTVDLLLGDGWKVVVVDDLSSGAVGNVASEADLEVVDISEPWFAAKSTIVNATWCVEKSGCTEWSNPSRSTSKAMPAQIWLDVC